jgi:transposase
MKIIGADACKGRLVFCCIDTNQPIDIGEFYRDGENFQDAKLNVQGLKQIMDLQPDVIAIEPTGVHYTRLWINRLSTAGVKIALIGHTQLRSYRKNLGLPDKDDPADALALGMYAAEHLISPRRFVALRNEETANMRSTVMHLGHLARVQSPIINKLHQSLSYAFPERADSTLNAPLFWRWLAGDANSLRYDAELAETIGIGLTIEIQNMAKMLNSLLSEERRVYAELVTMLHNPDYEPYRRIMSRFGMGDRTQAVLISQIFPITNFLGDDGQPIIELSKGKVSGKPTLKHLSRRRFSKMIGVAPTREQSGKSPTVTKKAGSEACRQALWMWHFTRVESGRSRLKGDEGERLHNRFTILKGKNPIKLARAKAIGKLVDELFYELVSATM